MILGPCKDYEKMMAKMSKKDGADRLPEINSEVEDLHLNCDFHPQKHSKAS